MDIEQLALSLPSGRPPQLDTPDIGVVTEVGSQPHFVAPDLVEVDIQPNSVATLITAPAAAGKSTCARAIARLSGAVYLDLAGKIVGDGSFNGLLDHGFGETAGFAFRQALKQNEAALVIDALDEAQVSSREAAFIKFVKSMCWYLRTSNGNGNVVMLARHDTSDYVVDTFEAEGLPLARYALQYFDQKKSLTFIDLKLDALYEARGLTPMHRRHRLNFEAVRDELLSAIGSTIEGGARYTDPWLRDEGRRLMGYSPVLEGIAGYLCVPDFRTVSVSTRIGEDQQLGGWRAISDLLKDLLLREQEKFLGAWPDSIERPYFADSRELMGVFTPAEQCARVIRQVQKLPVDPPASVVPTALSASYEDAVASQLHNHPFVGDSGFVSTLFRDFAIATVLLGEDLESRSARVLTQYLRAPSTLPSPGLGPFILTIGDSAGVPSRLFDVIVASIVAREDTTISYSFEMNFGGSDPKMVVRNLDRRSDQIGLLLRALMPDNAQVFMPPRSRSITVYGASDVQFPAAGLHLGPDVEIVADSIAFNGQNDVQVSASGIRLEAEIVVADWNQRVSVRGTALSILCDESEGWPATYAQNRPSSSDHETMHPCIRSLDKLLRRFRITQHAKARHAHADREELDSYVLKNDKIAAAIFIVMGRRGWITNMGRAYDLAPAFFESTNSSAAEIYEWETSPELRVFLDDVSLELGLQDLD